MQNPNLKIWAYLILVIGLMSCQTQETSTSMITKIDIEQAYQEPLRELVLSEVVEKVEYIKLQTLPGLYISQVGDIGISDNFLAIHSNELNNILLFSKTGEFLNTIGSPGEGPGEYVLVQDVYFHPHDPKIMVHDDISKKLLIYSLKGECLEEFNYSSLYRHSFVKAFFNQDGDIQVVLRRPFKKVENFPLVRILGQDFEETRAYHSITNEFDSNGSVSGFSNYWINNGEFYMHDFFFDNVYTQKDNDFFTLFKFNISENHSPDFYVPRNPGVWVYNSIPFVRSVGKYFLLNAFLPQIIEDGYIPMIYDKESNQLFRPESPKTTSYYDKDLQGINNDVDGFGQIVVTDTWV